MRVNALLALTLLVGVSITPGRVKAQTSTDSSTAGQSTAAPNSPAADNQPDGCFLSPSSTSLCLVGCASAANTVIVSRLRPASATLGPVTSTPWTACACG